MKCSVIVASNNSEVLESSLLASPDLTQDIEVIVERGAASAGAAYNAGLAKAGSDVLVFVHQDVFLPQGWLQSFREAAAQLQASDPFWAVMGAFGIGKDGRGHGHLYSTGLQRVVGGHFSQPEPVQTLDEVLLVVRRSSGLRFDESLPGFHLYGSDICVQAQQHGMGCYAFPSFCVHNTNGIRLLPWAYWKAWRYLRSKWWNQLPISTPCMEITRWGGAAMRHLIAHSLKLGLPSSTAGRRVESPALLYASLLEQKLKESV